MNYIGEKEAAIDSYTLAIQNKLDTYTFKACIRNIYKLLIQTGKFDYAIDILTKSLPLGYHGENADVLMLLSECYLKKGDSEKQEEYLIQAIENGDKNIMGYAYLNLGILSTIKKEQERALTCFDLAIKYGNDKVKGEANFRIGIMHFNSGNYHEAIVPFHRAINYLGEENNGNIFGMLACCYFTNGFEEEGEEYSKKAILYGNDQEAGGALINLGHHMMNIGNTQKAEEYYRIASSSGCPAIDQEAHRLLGKLYLMQERTKMALKEFIRSGSKN